MELKREYKKEMNLDKLEMAVCYYPEHWDKSLWESDLSRMKESGINTIRIAEFAWAIFEKRESEYTFELFDDFMKIIEKTDIKVIFGTPTATPPSWLIEKYPEVLNADIDGNLFRHGCRRNYNYNSPKYNELCAKIVGKVAEHFGKHESIIGWQIDNEINCELDEFYSESDSVSFREYLKNKYVTLDNLNKVWGTVFWSQTYFDWEDIYVPRKVIYYSNNPHQLLDYYRFISYSACKFAKMQSDILRKHIDKSMYITTNGMFGNLDNHKLTEDSLDFYMYDSYPNFAYDLSSDPLNSSDLNDRKWSRNLMEVRSISNIFGIMEQQSGANGWNSRMEAPAPKPGQLTLWTMQSVAHGADFISYFRWRTCTQGSEIYWHGILDYSNRDNRRLAEVKEVHEKFKKLKDVAGSYYKAKVGVLKDYDNIWDAQLDNWHSRVEKESQAGIFRGAQLSHTPLDYVYIRENTTLDDLKDYEVLFYPHASIMTEKIAKLCESYVENGGKLIFGSRTAYKNSTGQCVIEKLPWLLRNLTGTDVLEYTFVGPADEKNNVICGDKYLEANVFHDILDTLGDNAESIGVYENNYYKGRTGLVKNTFGKGNAYYYGGTFSQNTTIELLKMLGVATPYADTIVIPKECELAVRVKDNTEFIFVLNYSEKSQIINCKKSLGNLYTDEIVSGEITLKPYETIVLKNKN